MLNNAPCVVEISEKVPDGVGAIYNSEERKIRDDIIDELTSVSNDMMLSIDVLPISHEEAIREVEKLLLGVETNASNWQRRQNKNNNFTAQIPYDIAQLM